MSKVRALCRPRDSSTAPLLAGTPGETKISILSPDRATTALPLHRPLTAPWRENDPDRSSRMFERMGGRILLAIMMTGAVAGCAAGPSGVPNSSDTWPDSATALEDQNRGHHGGGSRGGGPRELSWLDGNPFPLDEGLADHRRRARAAWDAPDISDREVERVRAAERPDPEQRDIGVRPPEVRPARQDRSAREPVGLRPGRGDGRALRAPRS